MLFPEMMSLLVFSTSGEKKVLGPRGPPPKVNLDDIKDDSDDEFIGPPIPGAANQESGLYQGKA